MRIFFLNYSYERGLQADAGGFRKLWELAWALQALGHGTLVFYPALPGFSRLREVPSRACTVMDWRVLRPMSAYLSICGAALAAARQAKPDVVYFRTGLNILAPWIGRGVQARVLLEVNADAAEFHAQEGAPAWRRHLIVAAERLNVRKSDLVVALTPGLKRMLVERYEVPEQKIRVIPSGTDPNHFTPAEPSVAKQRLGFRPDQFVVGFVGLFYRHQGVHTLIEAAPKILAEMPRVRFLVVGDGVMRAQWEALAKRLGVSPAVDFPGQIPYRQIPTFLQAMDVVVAPFTVDRGETSPFKILDALACCRPVVASDLRPVRVLEERSGAVTLVPPERHEPLAEAVVALLRQPDRRRAMGAAGRAYVISHHSWDWIARQLVAAIEGS